MERYRLLIRKPAADELGRVPGKDVRRIVERIQALATEPRPNGCEKLSAQERYRLRQADYRIVYAIDDKEKIVEVVKIGHRGEIYRR
jgi:mRNA interferase RelE/StbE